MKFINALNALNTPWLAIIVILLGMTYSVVAHSYGMSGDAPSSVIGAGIGLLTGQALAAAKRAADAASASVTTTAITTTTETPPQPPAPTA